MEKLQNTSKNGSFSPKNCTFVVLRLLWKVYKFVKNSRGRLNVPFLVLKYGVQLEEIFGGILEKYGTSFVTNPAELIWEIWGKWVTYSHWITFPYLITFSHCHRPCQLKTWHIHNFIIFLFNSVHRNKTMIHMLIGDCELYSSLIDGAAIQYRNVPVIWFHPWHIPTRYCSYQSRPLAWNVSKSMYNCLEKFLQSWFLISILLKHRSCQLSYITIVVSLTAIKSCTNHTVIMWRWCVHGNILNFPPLRRRGSYDPNKKKVWREKRKAPTCGQLCSRQANNALPPQRILLHPVTRPPVGTYGT